MASGIGALAPSSSHAWSTPSSGIAVPRPTRTGDRTAATPSAKNTGKSRVRRTRPRGMRQRLYLARPVDLTFSEAHRATQLGTLRTGNRSFALCRLRGHLSEDPKKERACHARESRTAARGRLSTRVKANNPLHCCGADSAHAERLLRYAIGTTWDDLHL